MSVDKNNIVLERGKYIIKTTKADKNAARWAELTKISIKKAAHKLVLDCGQYVNQYPARATFLAQKEDTPNGQKS